MPLQIKQTNKTPTKIVVDNLMLNQDLLISWDAYWAAVIKVVVPERKGKRI